MNPVDQSMRATLPPPGDLQEIVGAPFLGFMVGSILFGATMLQAYQYYINYDHDSRVRKLTIAAVCILDSVHFGLSADMVYTSLMKASGYATPEAVRSLKAMAAAKTFLIVLVQSFYLHLIWILAGNILLNRQVSRIVKSLCVMTFIYVLGIASVFLAYVEQIYSLFHFSVEFQRMIFIAFISTAVIDSGIAFTMALVLLKTKTEARTHSRGVVQFLASFFVGTGLLTAISSILTIILYVSRPSTVLYLASEFSIPRLYANSIPAMFNAKSRLQRNMEASEEMRVPSSLFFGDPPNGPSE